MATNIDVLLFASLRDAAGSESIRISVDGPVTADALLVVVGEQFPALAGFTSHVRVAVDQQFCAPDQAIPEGSEVALVPPVSGG